MSTPANNTNAIIELSNLADLIFVGDVTNIDQQSVGIWNSKAGTMDKVTYYVVQCLKCESPMKPYHRFDVFYNGKFLGKNDSADIEFAILPSPGEQVLVFAEFVPTNPTNPYWGIGWYLAANHPIDTISSLFQGHSDKSSWHQLISENFYQNLDSLEKFAKHLLATDPSEAERLCKAVLSGVFPGDSRWRAPFYALLSTIYRLTSRNNDAELADALCSRCLNDRGQ